jgi:hypothetical protein
MMELTINQGHLCCKHGFCLFECGVGPRLTCTRGADGVVHDGANTMATTQSQCDNGMQDNMAFPESICQIILTNLQTEQQTIDNKQFFADANETSLKKDCPTQDCTASDANKTSLHFL